MVQTGYLLLDIFIAMGLSSFFHGGVIIAEVAAYIFEYLSMVDFGDFF
jgi:hypothetical protein